MAAQLARPSGLLGRFLVGRWLNRANIGTNALAMEALSLAPGERVLEVGFGGGGLIGLMLQRAASVAALDLSPAMVKGAGRRFRRAIREGGLELHCGDADTLPFEPAAFDAVVTLNTIYFWNQPEAVLLECRRVLRPGGRLVLGMDDAAELRAWPGHRYGFRVYEVEEVMERMRSAGFARLRLLTAHTPGRVHCVVGTAP
jgi:arsenite methyltransferase